MKNHAPMAQLDSASVYGTEGYRFEPCWVYLGWFFHQPFLFLEIFLERLLTKQRIVV